MSETYSKQSSGFSAPADELIAEGWTYKPTSNSDLVVRRKIRLYPNKFLTYHDFEKDPTNKKTWLLDGRCTLDPATNVKGPKTYSIRPAGTWTISATLGLEKVPTVDLYTFKLTWPTSWAASGYTDFSFCFEDLDEARKWLDHINICLSRLKAQKGLAGISLSTTQLSLPEVPSADDEAEEFHDLEDSDSEDSMPRMARRRYSEFPERWVPFKQVNGVSIYRHRRSATTAPSSSSPSDPETSSTTTSSGGHDDEYMVSAVIRGSPSEVLDVLLGGSANTTLLGPASHVDVLEVAVAEETDDVELDREVVRIVLEAPGFAGYFCAPREMVVQRVVKREEQGVFVVMFNSTEVKPGMEEKIKAASLQNNGWFSRPVRASVKGGYTIAPLSRKHQAGRDEETLITCITKVDVGGACSPSSWWRRLADSVGWTDAFIDRILMTVILVRDQVEHGHFVIQPFHMLASTEDKRAATDLLGLEEQQGPGEAGSPIKATRLGSVVLSKGDMAARVQALRAQSSSVSEAPGAAGALLAEPADFDLARVRGLAMCSSFAEIHTPGTPAPFSVRGPTYLKDRKKVAGGTTMFSLAAVDLVQIPHPVEHVARFLPSVRSSGAPFALIINFVVPGSPLLAFATTFACTQHPDLLGTPPADPMGEAHDWSAFDFVLHKFWTGDDATRNAMLKMIPHVAEGSWMMRQSVGTTPVIIGKALKTTYHVGPARAYLEVDIDITANTMANYVTGMVRGATKSLVMDLGFVLEGSAPWELPEALLGAVRLPHLDTGATQAIDVTREIPLTPAKVLGAVTDAAPSSVAACPEE